MRGRREGRPRHLAISTLALAFSIAAITLAQPTPSAWPVTFTDIAAAAGVSKATASKVLNHRGGTSDDTRLRVERAMKDLGFVSKPLTAEAMLWADAPRFTK